MEGGFFPEPPRRKAYLRETQALPPLTESLTEDALLYIMGRLPLISLGAISNNNRVLHALAQNEMSRRLQEFFRDRRDRIRLTPEERVQVEGWCAQGKRVPRVEGASVAQYMAFLLCLGATAVAEGDLGLARSLALWYVDRVLCLLQGGSYRVWITVNRPHLASKASTGFTHPQLVQFQRLPREGAAEPADVGFLVQDKMLLGKLTDFRPSPPWDTTLSKAERMAGYWADDRYYQQKEVLMAPPCTPLQHEEVTDALYACFSPYARLQDLYYQLPRLGGRYKWAVGRDQARSKVPIQLTLKNGQAYHITWPWRTTDPTVVEKSISRLDPDLAEALRVTGDWRASREHLDELARCWLGGNGYSEDQPYINLAYATSAALVAESFCKPSGLRTSAPLSRDWSQPPWSEYAKPDQLHSTPIEQASFLYSLSLLYNVHRNFPVQIPVQASVAFGIAAWNAVAIAGCDPLYVEMGEYFDSHKTAFPKGSGLAYQGIALQSMDPERYPVAHALLHHAPTALLQSIFLSKGSDMPGFTALGRFIFWRGAGSKMNLMGPLLHILLGAGYFDPEAGVDQRVKAVVITQPVSDLQKIDIIHENMGAMIVNFGLGASVPAPFLLLLSAISAPRPGPVTRTSNVGLYANVNRVMKGFTRERMATVVNQSFDILAELILIRRYGGEESYRANCAYLIEYWHDLLKRVEVEREIHHSPEPILEYFRKYLRWELENKPEMHIDKLQQTMEENWEGVIGNGLLTAFPSVWDDLPTIARPAEPADYGAPYLQNLAYLVNYYREHPATAVFDK